MLRAIATPQVAITGTRKKDPPLTDTEEFKATDNAVTQARARQPHWGIWISSAGRYWATRQGNARLNKCVHPGWAMTVDADSLAELETRIEAQKQYEQPCSISAP